MNDHEMYSMCVFFDLCVTQIWTLTVTELPTVKLKGFMTKCNGFYVIILLYNI